MWQCPFKICKNLYHDPKIFCHKKYQKMQKHENTQNSHRILVIAFFRGICLSRHQRIWNQQKILHFYNTQSDIFQEKFSLGSYSTFCKLCIFKHFAKNKSYFCQYLSFSVWFPLSLKHWSPFWACSKKMYFRTLSQHINNFRNY